MEIIIVICVYFIYLFFKASTNAKEQVERFKKRAFGVYVEETEDEINKIKFPIIKVSVSGLINNKETIRVKHFVSLSDVTDGVMPVISLLDSFQYDESGAFYFESEVYQLFFFNAYFNSDLVILKIPIDFLVFPKRGYRELKITAGFTDENGTILVSDSDTIGFDSKKNGYIDLDQDVKQAKEHVLKLAVLVTGADGKIDPAEVEIVKEYRNLISLDKHGKVDLESNRNLDKIMRETIVEMTTKPVIEQIDRLCNYLKDKADNSIRYEALELLLRISAVDGKYDKKEYEMVKRIANKLEIDDVLFQKTSDRLISVTDLEMDIADAQLVGLNDSMSVEEKKAHLRNEYKKWSQRVTNKDEKIRNQANSMLEIIASERAKLRGQK